MRNTFLALAALLTLALSVPSGVAAQTNDASAELKALVTKIQTQLRAGKQTEADLEPELKQFDTLLAEHKGEKTDAVAQILLMKAMLYKQVLHDTAKADAAEAQLLREFPDSKPAKMMKQEAEAEKVRKGLAVGAKFPEFNVKDLAGKPLSPANDKGHVVLIDFWATWCPPCRAELPNVIKTYKAYHPKGFDIIGVSLDDNRGKLTSFTKEQGMTWPQYFDGKGWQNELAVKYGVNSIPTTYLLDGKGVIIGKDLRGEELDQAVAKAVGK